jgi:hypothetical protein
MRYTTKRMARLGRAAVVVLAAVTISGCTGKTETPAEKDLTLEDVTGVMGKAEAQMSGAHELTRTADGQEINYHLYLAQPQDFDGAIGSDLAPKIERLYRKFGWLDKVTFSVETPDAANTAQWRPYCAFDMTRKVFEQLDWTNLLARDLFKVCKVTYR